MKIKVSTMIKLISVAIVSLLLVACGGGGSEEPAAPAGGGEGAPPAGEFQPEVSPITGAEAVGLLEVPDVSGTTPCGVFDVGSQGDRIVDLNDYENCLPSNPSAHDIACLNENAEWTDEFVSEPTFGGGTIEFVSSQTGICGIFIIDTGE